MNKNSKLKCSKCNSTNGFIKAKTKMFYCRNCGNETPIEKVIEI